MTPRRLLVPVDTTPECDAALAVAAGLALRGTLTLLEVVPIALPPSYGTGEREQRHLDQLGRAARSATSCTTAPRATCWTTARSRCSWSPPPSAERRAQTSPAACRTRSASARSPPVRVMS